MFRDKDLFQLPKRRYLPSQHSEQNLLDLNWWSTEQGMETLDRVVDTAQQIKEVYNQISPIVSGFFKK
jgi:hypothetical protein